MIVKFFTGMIMLLSVWSLTCSLELVNPLFLPNPIAVFKALFLSIASGEVLIDLFATFYRMIIGFIISGIIGITTGLLMGYSKIVRYLLDFSVDFFRSIPALSIFPLFMLMLGVGDKARIGVVIFSCTLIVLINTMYGVKNANQARIKAANMLGVSKAALFYKVIIWEALPSISTGLRISLSMSLMVVVVTEMFIGTEYGMGQEIYNNHLLYKIPEMYSAILLTGLLGFTLSKSFIHVEQKIVHWAGK